jgi:hypothetical protein
MGKKKRPIESSVCGMGPGTLRQALQDNVRRGEIEKLIALKGKVRFDLDWKTLRKGWSRNFARPR